MRFKVTLWDIIKSQLKSKYKFKIWGLKSQLETKMQLQDIKSKYLEFTIVRCKVANANPILRYKLTQVTYCYLKLQSWDIKVKLWDLKWHFEI